MKIGSRVRLKVNPSICGRILGFCGWRVDVAWNDGIVSGTHTGALVEIFGKDEFPFHSHRTMAEVIADEQKPVLA